MWILLLTGVLGYSVVTSPWVPMVSCSTNSTEKSKFSGYSIDLLFEIVEALGWSDSEWTLECMEWEPMLEAVSTSKVDMAIAGITITSERLNSMKFSTPTYDSGLMLIVKVQKSSLIWLFLEPFHFSLWISLVFIALFMGNVIWILERDTEGPIPFSYKEGILESCWHSFASLFFVGDKPIKTIPGRMMQLSYWFTSFVLLAAYSADLTSRMTLDQVYTEIKDHKDIEDKKVASLFEYENVIKDFGADFVGHPSWTYEGYLEMISHLKDGDYDAVALPHPIALYMTANDCEVRVVGDMFVPDYLAIAFPKKIDSEFMQRVSSTNLVLYENFVHRNLMNKNLLVTEDESCKHRIETPISITHVGGLWVIPGAALFLALPFYFLYKKYFKKKVLEEEKTNVSNKYDNKTAAEIDLMSKFEKILGSSEQKFSQKMKDIEVAIAQQEKTHSNFEEVLKQLESKLELLD